jgi:hypothetical protein
MFVQWKSFTLKNGEFCSKEAHIFMQHNVFNHKLFLESFVNQLMSSYGLYRSILAKEFEARYEMQ